MSIWGFVVAVICAIWCYKIAENNNRNAALAALLGLVFNFISVIVYYVLGPSKY